MVLSVRLSIRLVDQSKTVKVKITVLFSPYGGPILSLCNMCAFGLASRAFYTTVNRGLSQLSAVKMSMISRS